MINIQNNSSVTIHDQLVQKISNLIITGALAKDEKLPSVRALASELVINPHTVNKAYAELEEKGFILCEKNKGYFVKSLNDEIRDEELSKAFTKFDNITTTLLKLGISHNELATRVKRLGEKND